VELTHDVLCAVVKSSRDLRHAREAQESRAPARRERASEAATKKSLIRAAPGCRGVRVSRSAPSRERLFGYVKMKRAQEAEAKRCRSGKWRRAPRGEAEKSSSSFSTTSISSSSPSGASTSREPVEAGRSTTYAGLPADISNARTAAHRALGSFATDTRLRNLAKIDEAKAVLTKRSPS